MPRRIFCEEVSEVDRCNIILRRDLPEKIGKAHIAERLVVAEGLPIGGENDRLIGRGMLGEAAIDAVAEDMGVLQQIAEACFTGKPLVEKERVEMSAADAVAGCIGGIDSVGAARIDPLMRRCPAAALHRPERLGLRGRKNNVADALFDEAEDRFHIDGGFGQPDPFGIAAESFAEVMLCPADLRELVPPRGERHDDMVEHLRDGVAVAFEPEAALLIGIDDLPHGRAVILFEPAEKRSARS